MSRRRTTTEQIEEERAKLQSVQHELDMVVLQLQTSQEELASTRQQFREQQAHYAQDLRIKEDEQRQRLEQESKSREQIILAQIREKVEEKMTQQMKAIQQERMQFERQKVALLEAQEQVDAQLSAISKRKEANIMEEKWLVDRQSAIEQYHQTLENEHVRIKQTMALLEQEYQLEYLKIQESWESIKQKRIRQIKEKELAQEELAVKITQTSHFLSIQDRNVKN
ncbi:hypothetical protein IFR05_016055 [Cadophora sp. M221]|nr:hypothetical protein IFR05_016055 [Cadophora sp. M221]